MLQLLAIVGGIARQGISKYASGDNRTTDRTIFVIEVAFALYRGMLEGPNNNDRKNTKGQQTHAKLQVEEMNHKVDERLVKILEEFENFPGRDFQ